MAIAATTPGIFVLRGEQSCQFIDQSQKHVTGDVRLKLEPNRCYVVGRRAPKSLYDYGLATYDSEDSFRHEDSAGFVRLWGLGIETWAARQGADRVRD